MFIIIIIVVVVAVVLTSLFIYTLAKLEKDAERQLQPIHKNIFINKHPIPPPRKVKFLGTMEKTFSILMICIYQNVLV